LFARDVEDEVLPVMRELGVGLVAYSPVGRGLLTGRWRSQADLGNADYRNVDPRFQGENLQQNIQIVERVRELAEEKGCTTAQLAIAWVMAQGEDIVPIAGTRRLHYLKENLMAAEVVLGPEDLVRLEEAVPRGATSGERFGDMSFVNR
jgi:aryl-alcohol dehydrogenase-like predicted oxidoreductase